MEISKIPVHFNLIPTLQECRIIHLLYFCNDFHQEIEDYGTNLMMRFDVSFEESTSRNVSREEIRKIGSAHIVKHLFDISLQPC